MKLYCMCQGRSSQNHFVLNGKAQHQFDPALIHTLEPNASISKGMTFIKAGLRQVIPNGDGTYRLHYPNVDCYYCEYCGTVIIRE